MSKAITDVKKASGEWWTSFADDFGLIILILFAADVMAGVILRAIRLIHLVWLNNRFHLPIPLLLVLVLAAAENDGQQVYVNNIIKVASSTVRDTITDAQRQHNKVNNT